MKKALIMAALTVLAMSAALWGQVITVTAPAAGNEWCQGSTYTITWTSSGVAGPLAIKLRLAGAPDALPVMDITASTDNDGTFSWPIPASLAPGAYVVRVRTVTDSPLVYDDSGDFRINACGAGSSITVSSPMETGAYMVRGVTPISIVWTSIGITGNVGINLENWDSGVSYPIHAAYPYDGSPLSYPVPDGVAAGTYRVKVSQGTVVGYSGRIGILAYVAPTLTVTQPNGGETLTKGGHFSIYWQAQNIADTFVNIELNYRGRLLLTIARNQRLYSGYFYWRNILISRGYVKLPLGTGYRIRVCTTDGRFSDVSDSDFSIEVPPVH